MLKMQTEFLNAFAETVGVQSSGHRARTFGSPRKGSESSVGHPQVCFYKKSLTRAQDWCTLTSHPDESQECASASPSPPLFLGCTNSQWFVKPFVFYFKAQGSITLWPLEVFQIPVKPQPEISYFLFIWNVQNNASYLLSLCIVHKAMDHWLISVSHLLGLFFLSYLIFYFHALSSWKFLSRLFCCNLNFKDSWKEVQQN